MNQLHSTSAGQSVQQTQGLVVMAKSTQSNRPAKLQPIHPIWLRVTHWLNVVAVVIMVGSGWRIYNAAPVFELRFQWLCSVQLTADTPAENADDRNERA